MANEGRSFRLYELEGFEILVGKGAAANDELTLSIAKPDDFWLHAAGYAGSHVVIRNPDQLADIPISVVKAAAKLAVYHSKARHARGKVEVHLCRAADVRKPRGFAPGKVQIKRWTSMKVYGADLS